MARTKSAARVTGCANNLVVGFASKDQTADPALKPTLSLESGNRLLIFGLWQKFHYLKPDGTDIVRPWV
ncbi:hypothetical protein, partial [Paraburkholderia sp. SIMBA_030]|uniref:hypothetical protein n=1 Tax=Paraburkholderia sp. SIMBA_030 TaxID=3085773 RepID=UPI0039781732